MAMMLGDAHGVKDRLPGPVFDRPRKNAILKFVNS